jgi:pyruvate formate lyase activating enzyme
MSTAETLRESLTRKTRKGDVVQSMPDGWVRCLACGHRCKIAPGHDGICKVRFNRDGILYVPTGYVAGLAVDPIEKKPFFHLLPGSSALSFGMLGCDYHCAYCQNWITSQALRNPAAGQQPERITAEQIVALALEHRTPVITSTYNEPLITSEWAVEVFALARRHGILCSYVSNGNGTPEVLEYLRPYIQAYKVDLKGFRPRQYQQLGGKLQTVLDTIRALRGMKIWVEVVTLVVPGFNDTDEELRDIARFLVSVSSEIPWHVTAFHQDYQMTDQPPTSARALLRAAEIGYTEGLHYVYAGNLSGRVGHLEDTRCPSCNTLLIERSGFRILRNSLSNGRCCKCSHPVPGIWH